MLSIYHENRDTVCHLLKVHNLFTAPPNFWPRFFGDPLTFFRPAGGNGKIPLTSKKIPRSRTRRPRGTPREYLRARGRGFDSRPCAYVLNFARARFGGPARLIWSGSGPCRVRLVVRLVQAGRVRRRPRWSRPGRSGSSVRRGPPVRVRLLVRSGGRVLQCRLQSPAQHSPGSGPPGPGPAPGPAVAGRAGPASVQVEQVERVRRRSGPARSGAAISESNRDFSAPYTVPKISSDFSGEVFYAHGLSLAFWYINAPL